MSQIKSSQIPLDDIATPWDVQKPLPATRVLVQGQGSEPRGYVTHLTFKRTLIRNRIGISGVSALDNGTVVQVFFNNKLIRTVTLGIPTPDLVLDFKPGNNTLAFAPTFIPCSCKTAYLRIDYGNNVVPGQPNTSAVLLDSSLTSLYGPLGMPQIIIPRSRYPETVKHIENAWAGRQATPIGKNPLDRLGTPRNSPHFVTLDRLNRDLRARKSTYGITCSDSSLYDRDEYPPAVSQEDFYPIETGLLYRGNVRCIPISDNRGSGAFAKGQFDFYATTPTTTPTVKIPDGSTVEYVIGP